MARGCTRRLACVRRGELVVCLKSSPVMGTHRFLEYALVGVDDDCKILVWDQYGSSI